MLAQVFATATCLSVRLSIRLSQASIVSKHKILRVPRAGASKKGGVGKFSEFLALSVNISKMVADTAKVTISD